MKKLLFSWILLLTGTVLYAQPKTEDTRINLRNGIFTINSINIAPDWKLDPVVKYFTMSGRVRDGYNITHSYDEYGIAVFEKSDNKVATGIISEFQVYFSPVDKNSVAPTGLYLGKMEMERFSISMNTSLTDIRRILKDYKESDSYTSHSFRFASAGLYLYAQFDNSDTHLQKISVGKDTRQ